ncbi:hypothetical protein LINGRAHAP2_LOCUS16173 [Linum grandiflorum]
MAVRRYNKQIRKGDVSGCRSCDSSVAWRCADASGETRAEPTRREQHWWGGHDHVRRLQIRRLERIREGCEGQEARTLTRDGGVSSGFKVRSYRARNKRPYWAGNERRRQHAVTAHRSIVAQAARFCSLLVLRSPYNL